MSRFNRTISLLLALVMLFLSLGALGEGDAFPAAPAADAADGAFPEGAEIGAAEGEIPEGADIDAADGAEIGAADDILCASPDDPVEEIPELGLEMDDASVGEDAPVDEIDGFVYGTGPDSAADGAEAAEADAPAADEGEDIAGADDAAPQPDGDVWTMRVEERVSLEDIPAIPSAAEGARIEDESIAELDGHGVVLAKSTGETLLIISMPDGTEIPLTLRVLEAATLAEEPETVAPADGETGDGAPNDAEDGAPNDAEDGAPNDVEDSTAEDAEEGPAADAEDGAGALIEAASGRTVRIDASEIVRGLDDIRGREYEWTSLPIRPDFTLKYGGRTLKRDRDYCVRYRNNTDPGTASIQVLGMGVFIGSFSVNFRILDRPDVYLKPGTLRLGVGESYTLSAAGEGAVFTSDNEKVARVSAGGKVKARKKGSATITMRTSSGKTLTCAVKVSPAPKAVSISKSKLTLGIGQAGKIYKKLKPSGSGGTVTWRSTNTGVAVVEDGTVIPVSPGKAKIIVTTYNGRKAACAVTVKPAPTQVTLNRASAKMMVGRTLTLTTALQPAGARGTRTYSSSDASVASVNAKGKVKAKKPGQAIIYVDTYNGLQAECAVTVMPAPTGVSVNQKSAVMLKGTTLQLSATVKPAGAYPKVTWYSSDKKIATVDKNGLVTAKKAGKVKIGVKTANGKKAVCKLTVYPKSKNLSVKAGKTTLSVGGTTTVTVSLGGNRYSAVEWYVDGDAVTVDQAGHVTANHEGVATVYARSTAVDGLVAGVTITVKSASATTGAIIDISKWQGDIDFAKLKPAVSLVIARASCGTTVDSKFKSYAASMNNKGIPFGVYCYSKASTPDQARAEARALYKAAKDYHPKFYTMDAEEACITQAAVTAFIDELRNLGAAKAGAYVGHHRYKQYGISKIKNQLDFVWIPRYGSNTGTVSGATEPDFPCDLWQYTSNGKVPGISGRVDMNKITGTGRSLSWFIS